MKENEKNGLHFSDSEIYTASNRWDKMAMGWVTKLLLLSCCTLFFSSLIWLQKHPIPEEAEGLSIYRSPITRTLLYDYPLVYQLLNRLIDLDGYEALENRAPLSERGRIIKEHLNHLRTWTGVYPILEKGGFQEIIKQWKETPTFEKIRQGEVWRLFTPIFLHGDLFHLLFNMIWLIAIGKQVEQRLGSSRYIFFILLVALFSNTAQYLMSGPNFLGISGVLCGMLAFIWVRKSKAPWEDYRVDRSTLLFMLIFVFGMAALDLFAFLIEKFYDYPLSLHLANSAHISGGIVGWILGKSNVFNWRES